MTPLPPLTRADLAKVRAVINQIIENMEREHITQPYQSHGCTCIKLSALLLCVVPKELTNEICNWYETNILGDIFTVGCEVAKDPDLSKDLAHHVHNIRIMCLTLLSLNLRTTVRTPRTPRTPTT